MCVIRVTGYSKSYVGHPLITAGKRACETPDAVLVNVYKVS